MIQAKNLSVEIGGKFILKDVSARMENGKVTAILGPNGAGKSTLLQCLTGSRKGSTGMVTLNDKPLTEYSLKDLSTKRAVLSQSNPINFPFTVLEMAMMGRNPYADGDPSGKNYEIVLKALECMDALHLKKRIFPFLSGGERQRVHLARVLAQLWEKEDAFLFLDEPTSALDLKHQHRLLSLISKLALEKHFAVCVIIHDLNLVLRYADQIILLKEGKLFAEGNTESVLNKNAIENVFEVPERYVFASKRMG